MHTDACHMLHKENKRLITGFIRKIFQSLIHCSIGRKSSITENCIISVCLHTYYKILNNSQVIIVRSNYYCKSIRKGQEGNKARLKINKHFFHIDRKECRNQ